MSADVRVSWVDLRVVWASRAAGLMDAAREIRELRDRNTGPREAPEPLPEAYELCLAEAAVFATLATVSDSTAEGVYAEVLRSREGERQAQASLDEFLTDTNSATTQPNREDNQ